MYKPIRYVDKGVFRGSTPTGEIVTIKHLQHGARGFEILWNGRHYRWLYMGLVEEELGITVNRKQSGPQEGRPSEAVLRAIYRHFVKRYNAGDSKVELLVL